jgi:tetratricopeptide (TPR) repeat protein
MRARFCLQCGASFSARCAGCGAELPSKARFCLECGRPVDPPSPAPAPDPRSFTPKHLAEKILSSRSALEGERKQACGQILGFGWRMGLPEEEAERTFEQGRALSELSGDKRSLAILHWAMGGLVGLRGGLRRYLQLGLEAVRIADATNDAGLRLAVRGGLTYAYYSSGLLRQAYDLSEELLRKTPDDLRIGADINGFAPYIFLQIMQGLYAGYLRDLKPAERAVKDALELAKLNRGDVELLCWGRFWLGDLAEVRGDAEAAFQLTREGLEIAEQLGAPFHRSWARVNLARAHLLRNEWSDAKRCAEEALAIAREQHAALEGEARVLATIAEAQLGEGNLAQARQIASEAIDTAERRGTYFWEIFARLALARALLAADGTSAAEVVGEHLTRAGALIERAGAKALEPFLRVELAKLARLRGDEAACQAKLREAHRLFVEIGAPLRAAEVAKELTG